MKKLIALALISLIALSAGKPSDRKAYLATVAQIFDAQLPIVTTGKSRIEISSVQGRSFMVEMVDQ